jgi:intracellular septation protein
MTTDPKPKPPSWLAPAIDYGPLLIFFVAYKLTDVFRGTAVFMVAIAIAVLVSRVKLGRVSPMLWLSAILIMVFGGLTIWMHDQRFIQFKPTIIYAILAAILFGGILIGKPLLKYVFEVGYHGLSDRGWMLLSRNWAVFFAVLAVINEIIRRLYSFDQWMMIKVYGIPILSVLFAMANLPMLMRHGMGQDAAPEQDSVPPA